MSDSSASCRSWEVCSEKFQALLNPAELEDSLCHLRRIRAHWSSVRLGERHARLHLTFEPRSRMPRSRSSAPEHGGICCCCKLFLHLEPQVFILLRTTMPRRRTREASEARPLGNERIRIAAHSNLLRSVQERVSGLKIPGVHANHAISDGTRLPRLMRQLLLWAGDDVHNLHEITHLDDTRTSGAQAFKCSLHRGKAAASRVESMVPRAEVRDGCGCGPRRDKATRRHCVLYHAHGCLQGEKLTHARGAESIITPARLHKHA
mmetsp:Transcript_18115/g.56848  ORF Transcript_18115/g.56848 Transcript_18115/m.56848 type:complete len:263 (-) Transcript_18115:148-936(-)